MPPYLGDFSSFARSWYQLENVVIGTGEVDLMGQESMIFSQNKATYGTKQGNFWQQKKLIATHYKLFFFDLSKVMLGNFMVILKYFWKVIISTISR
jgi:hypothetical protein